MSQHKILQWSYILSDVTRNCIARASPVKGIQKSREEPRGDARRREEWMSHNVPQGAARRPEAAKRRDELKSQGAARSTTGAAMRAAATKRQQPVRTRVRKNPDFLWTSSLS